MKASWAWLPLMVCWGAEAAQAQSTTVQLPSYQYFTTGTSVSVPDCGSAYLGGVNRAQSGRNEFGSPLSPLKNRAFGSRRSTSGASVSVYIHDFAALEEELLGQSAASGRTPRTPAVAGSPDRGTSPTGGLHNRGGDLRSEVSAGSGDPRRARRALGDPPLPGIEEIRRQRRLEQEAREAEARDFFERGQAAEDAGRTNVARIYYQMAAKRASGSFKDEVLAKLDGIRREQTPKLGGKGP
jgi:hypothetical protein